MRRVLALAVVLVATMAAPVAASAPPRTGFETTEGAAWTTFAEEQSFLRAVDAASRRVAITRAGRTLGGKPIDLVMLGHPAPRPVTSARTRPTVLFVCSQHGNEPAGREACLKAIRDLAFTTDARTTELLSRWTVLFVPNANPDGREANTRENSTGVDVNRDHLNMDSNEGRAIGRVIRDWRPDVVVDLHEYGPGVPLLYDDDLLYLWPRNLNVDPQVHGLSKTLALDYIGKGARTRGYTADEYGQAAVGDQDLAQTAGDGDEGILRNTAGLRHAIGILVETRVDMGTSPEDIGTPAAVNLRRVASHEGAIADTLRFMREQESIVELATEGAPLRKAREGRERSAPVYFGGADNDPPQDSEVADPPPCGYRLSGEQAAGMRPVFELHGIRTTARGTRVSMAQAAEPLIPLLVDARGARAAVHARPVC